MPLLFTNTLNRSPIMYKVLVPEAKRFVTDCLKAVGARGRQAELQADLCIYADRIGHTSHGLVRLDAIIDDIKAGLCIPSKEPVVLKESSSRAWIDVNSVMGATAGRFAMDLAVKMANNTGLGWVAVAGATYDAKPYNYWVNQAADLGLIGTIFNSKKPSTTAEVVLEEDRNSTIDINEKKTTNQIVCIKDVDRSVSKYIEEDPSRNALMVSTNKNGFSVTGMMTTLFNGFVDKRRRKSKVTLVPKNFEQNFVALNPTCFALGFDSNIGLPDCVNYCKDVDTIYPKLPDFVIETLEEEPDQELEDTPLLYKVKLIDASMRLAQKLSVKPITLVAEDKPISNLV